MIKVLIIDDSMVARELVRHILSSDPALSVVGMAASGEEGVRMATALRPDVITMDIHMPGINGYEATRLIMEQSPTPIVVVSASTSPDEIGGTFRALTEGAVALFERPVGVNHPDFENQARMLCDLVRAMAEVPMVRRWARDRGARDLAPAVPAPQYRNGAPTGVVCLGASTGGPLVLQTILRDLILPFPLPVLMVQHIAVGFLAGFIEWLASTTGHAIRTAVDGELLEAGVVLVAPDGHCLALGPNGTVRLAGGSHGCSIQPSVGHLFETAAATFGNRSIGVLLTGMGRDGAAELLGIRQAGGRTIAQDEASSVVFGMPGQAAKLGAAEVLLPPDRIGPRLNELAASVALK